jgi:hypothetical protein
MPEDIYVKWPHGGWLLWNWEKRNWDHVAEKKEKEMPQALDEQRNLMKKWFGDAIDMDGPYRFLKARGWGDHAGILVKPTPSHKVSEYEWECVAFLCDEWDFGYEG